jgi:hypothetical protein
MFAVESSARDSTSAVTVGIGVGGSGSAVGFDAGLAHAAATTAIMIATEISRELRDIRGILVPVTSFVGSAHSAQCERVDESSGYMLFVLFRGIMKILQHPEVRHFPNHRFTGRLNRFE